MQWYLTVLKQYATFSGRASRSEFWYFQLFNVLVYVVLAILDSVIGTNGALVGLYALGTLLPSLAVIIRRLHDTGKSGWWIFIELVPAIGAIWLIVLLATDTAPAGDKFGSNPKLALA